MTHSGNSSFFPFLPLRGDSANPSSPPPPARRKRTSPFPFSSWLPHETLLFSSTETRGNSKGLFPFPLPSLVVSWETKRPLPSLLGLRRFFPPPPLPVRKKGKRAGTVTSFLSHQVGDFPPLHSRGGPLFPPPSCRREASRTSFFSFSSSF